MTTPKVVVLFCGVELPGEHGSAYLRAGFKAQEVIQQFWNDITDAKVVNDQQAL